MTYRDCDIVLLERCDGLWVKASTAQVWMEKDGQIYYMCRAHGRHKQTEELKDLLLSNEDHVPEYQWRTSEGIQLMTHYRKHPTRPAVKKTTSVTEVLGDWQEGSRVITKGAVNELVRLRAHLEEEVNEKVVDLAQQVETLAKSFYEKQKDIRHQ